MTCTQAVWWHVSPEARSKCVASIWVKYQFCVSNYGKKEKKKTHISHSTGHTCSVIHLQICQMIVVSASLGRARWLLWARVSSRWGTRDIRPSFILTQRHAFYALSKQARFAAEWTLKWIHLAGGGEKGLEWTEELKSSIRCKAGKRETLSSGTSLVLSTDKKSVSFHMSEWPFFSPGGAFFMSVFVPSS